MPKFPLASVCLPDPKNPYRLSVPSLELGWAPEVLCKSLLLVPESEREAVV